MLRGRRYRLQTDYSYNLARVDTLYATDYDLTVEAGGAISLATEAAQSFSWTASPARIAVKAGQLTINRNTYGGTISLTGLNSNTSGALVTNVIVGRRYIANPPNTFITFPTVGACTPAALQGTPLTVSCGPLPTFTSCTGQLTMGMLCDDGNLCTEGTVCSAAGTCGSGTHADDGLQCESGSPGAPREAVRRGRASCPITASALALGTFESPTLVLCRGRTVRSSTGPTRTPVPLRT